MSKTQLNTGSQATPLAEPATAGIDSKDTTVGSGFRFQLPTVFHMG